jgi:serine/threonine protein kinase
MMEIFLDEINKSIEGEFDMYFKYIEKIASGAFGTVIRAYYYEMETEVAVKVIDKTKHKFKNINRLKFEIDILKQLKHKNIVEFIGCIETNSKMYIITEYIQEGTLKDLIDLRQKTGIFSLYNVLTTN